MAAPAYTEDLNDINLAEAITNWAEPTATGWTDGGIAVQDIDYPYIQGSYAVLQATSKAAVAGLLYNNGSGITIPTDGALFIWQNFYSPPVLETYANGGLRVMIGSGLAAFDSWDVGGRDAGRMPYGGWQNHAVNPSVQYDDRVGSPSGTYQYMGTAVYTTAGIGKGYPHNIDAVRYGRGSSVFASGEAGNPCTFAGYAAQNDNVSYRWGLISSISGGFLWKGKMTFGTTQAACYFTDQNKTVLVDNTPKVTANFNTIEVNNASTTVNMTNVIFSSPSGEVMVTASPGRFLCNANADLNFESCQFVNMGGDFTFGGTGSEFLNCVWRKCGQLIVEGGNITGSQVLTSIVSGEGAVYWNVADDPDGNLDDITVTMGSYNHHALEFGTSSPTTMTLRNITVSGFSSSDGLNNSALKFDRTTGSVTVNLVGCTGSFSYKSLGAAITFVVDPVDVAVTVLDLSTGYPITGARVFVRVADDTNFPYQDSVTITGSGTTATVNHVSHGLDDNDWILISGANEDVYNGSFQITTSGENYYTYTTNYTITSSPATGTITATMVLINEDTVSGEAAINRTFASSQLIAGWVRKSSGSPYYVQGSIAGEVSSTAGFSTTVQLVRDE